MERFRRASQSEGHRTRRLPAEAGSAQPSSDRKPRFRVGIGARRVSGPPGGAPSSASFGRERQPNAQEKSPGSPRREI